MNRLKNVIKENRKSEKKEKKKKHPDFDEIHELIVKVDRHITIRIKNMATANMQTDDEVDSPTTFDTESALCGNCKTQVVDGMRNVVSL